jgi:hypothetical protein
VSTGPLPPRYTEELQELKWRLAGLEGVDLSTADAAAIGAEISAIRLHLKRLALERQALEERARGRGEGGS